MELLDILILIATLYASTIFAFIMGVFVATSYETKRTFIYEEEKKQVDIYYEDEDEDLEDIDDDNY